MWAESLQYNHSQRFFFHSRGNFVGAPIARSCGLVDAPNARKRHDGEIPIIGGAAIFGALALTGFFWGDSNESVITVNGNDALWVFMGCGAFLVITGMLTTDST